MNTSQLPITRNLSLAYTLSLAVALLMVSASLAGLFFQSAIYPTEGLRQSFVANDVVNLLVGFPILLGSMRLTKRGRLIGLLFWPGALLYTVYNYIAYAVAMPLTVQVLIYLALVVLSASTIARLIFSIDGAVVKQRLSGSIPERFAGGILTGFGALFFLRSIGQLMSALSGQVSPAAPTFAVVIADLLTMPVWLIGGVLLWRKQALGYVSGLGLLFQASTLFIGLLIFFILQPFLADTLFPLTDFLVIFVMGLFFFIPLGMFAYGIIRRQNWQDW